MKKWIAILCMTACLFGLTACGGGAALTPYEQQKVDYAQQLATEMMMPMFSQFMAEEAAVSFDQYTAEEVEYILSSQDGITADGNAFLSALDSFRSAKADMGAVTETGGSTARIDGDQIIVEVDVKGEKKDAKAEFIFSNDLFMKLESAAMNPSSSVGELMTNAALNTVIGMGTVFAVLILICEIIGAFSAIPKLQARMAKKKAPVAEAVGVDKAVSQIVEQESIEEEAEDDCELVAVIAAAIAASEGAVTTDGFVVRSIRRR